MPCVQRDWENTHEEMTPRQLIFCEAYLANGHCGSAAARAAGYKSITASGTVLKQKGVIAYLDKRKNAVAIKYQVNYDYKIKKLAVVVEEYLPTTESGAGIELEADKVRIAIEAIKELNKMQGDYAAEKRSNVNINVDIDIERGKQIMSTLVAEYSRDY